MRIGVNDRRVISGMVHMLRSGTRWRDCPAAYALCNTVYNRFNAWSRQGVWSGIFYADLRRMHSHSQTILAASMHGGEDSASVSVIIGILADCRRADAYRFQIGGKQGVVCG